MTKIINLYGGPGSGKSTTAADIFTRMKQKHINCEMALEYVKEKIYEESFPILHDQIYIFGKQLHKLNILNGKVDYIITDAPLLLQLVYGEKEVYYFKELVKYKYNQFNNLNFYLIRPKNYQKTGRVHTEEQAQELDKRIGTVLRENCKHLSYYDTSEDVGAEIVKEVLR